MSNKTIKLPLRCGKIDAHSKRQARALFALKNDSPVCDAEIFSAWPQFQDLPEVSEYVISEPSAYNNDHRAIICEAGIFPYGHGQEIVGVLRREKGKVVVSDGYYLSAIHRGSLIFLSNKSDVREYVRKCCSSEIRHEMSRHEATAIMSKLTDEKIDLFLNQILANYSQLQESDIVHAGNVDWHWNDRDA